MKSEDLILKTFIINENDAGQRLDKFLTKSVKNLPKNLMYKYIRLKRIKLNRKRCEISTRLSVGDELQLYINDEFFESPKENSFLNVSDKIQIVYEDENILLVDKPSGLVVHEDDDNSIDTLINRIKHYLYNKKEYNPDNELSFAPSLCNRLDRNTTGIVICAKNAESLRILNQKIKNREIHKFYLCVCIGSLDKKENTLKNYLFKDEKNKTVRIEKNKKPNNKQILTKYKVIKEKNNLSLLEIDLLTGRTHQIRAHLSFIGHPLLGDGKYGINSINKKYGVKTQALCANRLTFDFKTDAGILKYLNHKTFCTDSPWFVDKFF